MREPKWEDLECINGLTELGVKATYNQKELLYEYTTGNATLKYRNDGTLLFASYKDRYVSLLCGSSIIPTNMLQSILQDVLHEIKDMTESLHDVVAEYRQKTEELFHEVSGYTAREIEGVVWEFAQGLINENGLDAEIVDVIVTGSRSRGIERADSDLDVVVEYKGSEREDDFFSVLHSIRLNFGQTPVDINPITEWGTGTLETYLPQAESYLQEKMELNSVQEDREQEDERR